MGVKTCIPSRSRELLVILIAYVTTGPRVLISLSETEVDHVDDVLVVRDTDQEIIRFDVSVKEPALVDELNAL